MAWLRVAKRRLMPLMPSRIPQECAKAHFTIVSCGLHFPKRRTKLRQNAERLTMVMGNDIIHALWKIIERES